MKIKLSKNQWEAMGKKAGWMKSAQIIPDDGIADGGTPYTNEEMDLMQNKEEKKAKIRLLKDEVAKIVNEFNDDLLTKEGFMARLTELANQMSVALGVKYDPNQDIAD